MLGSILVWNTRYGPSLSDMLRPSMQTLKHIVVNIHVDKLDDDFLFGIPSELEDMRTENIIETVVIQVIVHWKIDESYRRGDVWSRLDKVLTAPGWFSLKRVSLIIEIANFDNEVELALRKLPELQFPQLSSSNSISFDFKAISYLF